VKASWKTGSKYTKLSSLKLSHLPSGATIELTCGGKGCPFKHRSLKAHGSTAKFSSSAHLRASAKLTLAPNSVAQVVVFTIRKGKARRTSDLCLPPGATGPSSCA
jgi:hypothetical protein